MTLTIREASMQDYSRLCEMMDQVDDLHRRSLPHLFRKPSGAVREVDYIRSLLEDANTALFVADPGEQLAGFVHVYVRDTEPIPIRVQRRYAVIDDVGVRPEFQHRGIGRALMNKALDWALSRGAESVELSVYEFNHEAMAFYDKLGFQTLSRRMSKSLP